MYDRDRLAHVIDAVAKRLSDVRVPGITENLFPLLEVSGSFVRGCLDCCRGVLILTDAKEPGGIVAAERAGWEMWNELDYLLRLGDPPTAAVKVQVNALLDVIGQLEELKNVPKGMLQRNKDGLMKLETAYPAAAAEVRKQRKKGRMHWSGKSRSSVVGPNSTSRAVYKMLSWEAHPDVCAIRDISTEVRDGEGVLILAPYELSEVSLGRSAANASEFLLRSWNLFAQFWQQEQITDAPPRKSV